MTVAWIDFHGMSFGGAQGLKDRAHDDLRERPREVGVTLSGYGKGHVSAVTKSRSVDWVLTLIRKKKKGDDSLP